MSKYLDSNGLLYLWQKIKNYVTTAISGKVDAVSGKGLSTNDYTTDEKTKLAGIEAQANKYVHPEYTAAASGLYKVTVDETGHVSAAVAVTKNDITALGISGDDTTYGLASSNSDGLMASADKTKLDAFGEASTYALKTDLTSLYKYIGSVATVSDLPLTSTIGYVYNVESSGMNYAWNGTTWDALGQLFTIEVIENTDIDTIVSSS